LSTNKWKQRSAIWVAQNWHLKSNNKKNSVHERLVVQSTFHKNKKLIDGSGKICIKIMQILLAVLSLKVAV